VAPPRVPGAAAVRNRGPGGVAGDLLRLQRAAGNRAVTAGLVAQRCGPRPCECPAEEREAAERAEPAPVQRLDADLEVTGKSGSAATSPRSVFFDRNQSAIDAVEDAKLAALAGTPASSINLKGYASEEETGRPALANARIDAVTARLTALSPGTGSPTKSPDLGSSVGQLNYRGARQVEILVAGAASAVPNCAAGADIACGPSPNAFDKGFDAATTTLLPAAITALSSPGSPPAKDALKLFGGAAHAADVKNGLGKIAAQFPNLAPAIPLNDHTAAGHRCINSCEGDVLAYNSGSGPAARMTVGPQYLAMADPIEQGLTLIHEASHGATGLMTDDKAYDWQRLLAFLPPAVALQNADSFTHFVRLIHTPGAASGAQVDTATALPAAKRQPALEALAWLEQWLVQGRLTVRSLYSAAHHAVTSGAWAADDLFYRDNTMKQVSTRFGMTAPPAVPTLNDKASIAGIFDRLMKLRFAVTGSARTLRPGAAPSTWDAGPGPNITLSTGFFGLSKRGKVERLLVMVVDAAPFVESARKTAYVALVKDMSADFGGP
jgi:hypothetical protein